MRVARRSLGVGDGWRSLVGLAFGSCCLTCGAVCEGSHWSLCVECARDLPLIRGPACRTCGHPFSGLAGPTRQCTHCETLQPAFGRGRSALLLSGPARVLIHAFKYRGNTFLIRDIQLIMSEMEDIRSYVEGAVLVPVPLHPRKLRERGYNQSQLIAEALADGLGGAVGVRPLLDRVRDTSTQTRLDREARRANLKNAFALAGPTGLYPGLSCILVDDVFTTGSTLNACAEVLRDAGCRRVDVLTLGHG